MVIKINLNKIAKYTCILCTLPISITVLLLMKVHEEEIKGRVNKSVMYGAIALIYMLSTAVILMLSFIPNYRVQEVGNPISTLDGITQKVEMRVFADIILPWSTNKVKSYIRWANAKSDIIWIDVEKAEELSSSFSQCLEKSYQAHIKLTKSKEIVQTLLK